MDKTTPDPTSEAAATMSTSEHKSTEGFRKMRTGIDSLDRLFTHGEDDQGHIVYAEAEGFFGVIIGAAGTGKSVLALQLCCGHVKSGQNNKAVYLSQESFETVKGRIVGMFGFIGDEAILTRSEIQLTDKNDGKKLAIIQMPLDPSLQQKTIRFLLRCLAERAEVDTYDLMVCFDSAETIHPEVFAELLGKPTKSDEKDHYKELRACCQQRRLNTWWIYEEKPAGGGGENSTASIASTPQAYAADVVIRLSTREVANSTYRERDIEIIKARHQACRRGRHPFSVYSEDDTPFRKPNGTRTLRNTGITIWPSVATQLSRIRSRDTKPWDVAGAAPVPATVPPGTEAGAVAPATLMPRPDTLHTLGIEDIDAAVLQIGEKGAQGYLHPGSTSVLVSDLDSLASEIGLHFALLGGMGEAARANERSVILSLASDEKTLRAMIHPYSALQSREANTEIKFFGPNFVSEGKLLHDIEQAIGDAKRIVVDNLFAFGSRLPLIRDPDAFVAALFSLLKSKNAASLVIDLVEVGEGRNPLSESFAAGLADNVFLLRHVEFQSQLRKIFHVLKLAAHREPAEFWELEQRADRIYGIDRLDFYKGVLSGRPEQLEINVSLYAEAEGSPLDLHLKTQGGVMSQTFGQTVKINICHHSTYAALQISLATDELRPLGDCHVISIDEIWLKQLIAEDKLAEFSWEHFLGKDGQNPQENYYQWVTAGYDIAIRALLRTRPSEGKPRELEEIKNKYCYRTIVAAPDRNNAGILAYNPNVWNCRLGETDGHVALLPGIREWASGITGTKSPTDGTHLGELPWEANETLLCWHQLVALQNVYLRFCRETLKLDKQWMPPSIYREWEDWKQPRKAEETDMRRFDHGRDLWSQRTAPKIESDFFDKMPKWGVFTFSMNQRESCVCFLLELLLSLLDENSLPVDTAGKLHWNLEVGQDSKDALPKAPAWTAGLGLLLKLLSPWDILRLSHSWYRSTNDERPCLFSRQWFSSWGALGLREPGLWVKELPRGAAGCSTPVSGTWYLGILKGSTAVRAGARLIQYLASERTELFKLNRGIGLPVRARLFGPTGAAKAPPEVRVNVPYREQFLDLQKQQQEHETKGRRTLETWCPQRVLRSRCPFYRSLIDHYDGVSLLLMGMIVAGARAALEQKEWLWKREEADFSHLEKKLGRIVTDIQERYQDTYR